MPEELKEPLPSLRLDFPEAAPLPVAVGRVPLVRTLVAAPGKAAIGGDDGGKLNVQFGLDLEDGADLRRDLPSATTTESAMNALDDDSDLVGTGLELQSMLPPAPDAFAAQKKNALAATQAPGSGSASAPAVVATVPRALSVAEQEVAALGGFGPPPTSLPATVPYALRTWLRRRTLEKLLAGEVDDYAKQRRFLQEKMAALADEVRSKAGCAADDPFELAFKPIDDSSQAVSLRSSELGEARASFDASTRGLDDEAVVRETERAAILAQRKKAQVVLEDGCAHQARDRAALLQAKRGLEVAHDAAGAAAGASEFAPPEFARRIVELEGQKARLEQALRGHDVVVAEGRRAVQEVERKLSQHDRAAAAIDARRQSLSRDADELQKQRRTAVEFAQQSRLNAYEAALRLLVVEHPATVGEAAIAQFAEICGVRDVAEREVEKLRRATTSYDAEAYRRGASIGGAVIAAVVGALGFVLAR
ncbi:MAG: hypothetical protein EXR75_03160 [Myxococcales bacterium]|nr:hypothetical protein [Myxococcales bacterium]